MGWASGHIAKLRTGETVSFRPTGNSMRPRVESGQLCTVRPVSATGEVRIGDIVVGDIVLCRVRGREYLHVVKAIQEDRFQIGNNRGGINGWTSGRNIFGLLVKVEG
jgi:hypothetical protein